MNYFMMLSFAQGLLLACGFPDPITTVHIEKHDGPIYISPSDQLSCDNQVTIGNRSPTDCSGATNNQIASNHSPTDFFGTNYCSPTHGNRSPSYATYGNPTTQYDNALLHNTNHNTLCGRDCKCVTKQLNTYVPINTVPQNNCNPGYYPDYNAYSYGYPVQNISDGCPAVSDGLIPLLKSYLEQSKSTKKCCKCGKIF